MWNNIFLISLAPDGVEDIDKTFFLCGDDITSHYRMGNVISWQLGYDIGACGTTFESESVGSGKYAKLT